MDDFRENGLGCAVVLPSYKPCDKLDAVISGLIDSGFGCIVVVDDGSGPEYAEYFQRAESRSQCVLLRHERNRGKGAALKTAFEYLERNRPDIKGAVTADGDGQHRPSDVLKCAQALCVHPDSLILGTRDFSSPDIPARSRTGNRITSFVFRTGCGIKISDTQTGLRAFSSSLFKTLLSIKGERYEYETNMLLELHRMDVPFTEVEIETIYEDNNATSHFRPVLDSIRIYSLILKYMASSLASAGVDLFVFWLTHMLFGARLGEAAAAVCTAVARVISSFFNFNVNKKLVFGSGGHYGRAMLRYYSLCTAQLLLSAGLLTLVSRLLGVTGSGGQTLLKVCVDSVLFILSFRIQRKWVFRNEKDTAE